MQGDYGPATAMHDESLSMKREAGDRRGITIALSNLGRSARAQGDYESDPDPAFTPTLSIGAHTGPHHS